MATRILAATCCHHKDYAGEIERGHRTLSSWSDLLRHWGKVLPAMRDIYVPVWELRRRIHTLRIVEALRDYASRNDAALPKSLDEIHETPIPNDVVTGEPFQYRWESGQAFLSAPGIETRNEILPGVRLHIRVR